MSERTGLNCVICGVGGQGNVLASRLIAQVLLARDEHVKTAETIGSLLSMAVKPGNSSIFVGKKEFEIMKKPGRGTHGHIAILTNNVDRAIYHLSQRGVKFDMDSKNVKDGKTIAIYFADEVAGFAIHLVQK